MKLVITRIRVEKCPSYDGRAGFRLEMVADHEQPGGLTTTLRESDPEQARAILAAYGAWCMGERDQLEIEINVAELLRQAQDSAQ